MDEQLYVDLIAELNSIKDAGGKQLNIKTYKCNDAHVTFGISMSDIDDIQVRINGKTLIYTDGVYCNVPSAIYNGMSLTEIENDGGYYVPEGVTKDLKETIDAAIEEFYKFHTKI